MNLWLRLAWLMMTVTGRQRLPVPFGVSRLNFRVWPNDLDTSLHMNNGRYWALMDLGRTDLMLRAGLWRVIVRRRWVPVITHGAIRFRRELRLFQRVRLETRLVTWSETRFVIEHRMMTNGTSLAASSLVQGGLYDRGLKAFVPVSDLFEMMSVSTAAPPLTPEIDAFLRVASSLP